MKPPRLAALTLAIALAVTLGGYVALRSPEVHPAADVALMAPVAPVRDDLPSRASRSRSYVAPTPSMSPKHVHPPIPKATTPSPHRHPVTTRRQTMKRTAVAGSRYSRVSDITMYCSGTTTASGKRVREGMVATLDRSIPFGTVVQIEGLGSYVVEDRIGHGSEFDIYSSSCGKARQFGRHHLSVSF